MPMVENNTALIELSAYDGGAREPSCRTSIATKRPPTSSARSKGKQLRAKSKRQKNQPESHVAINPSTSTTNMKAVDPFPYRLRCDTTKNERSLMRVMWHSPHPHIPLEAENAILPILMKFEKGEKRMAKLLPDWRLAKIKKACYDHRVPLLTALSLRRHHIQKNHRVLRVEQLQLGTEQDIRESARLFERCVQIFLDRHKVKYWDETQQCEHNRGTRSRAEIQGPLPPTPDFLLREEIVIVKYADYRNGRPHIVEQKRVCWVEVKMFYGASTIPLNQKSAVGCLLATAEKYVKNYGPGAMVFMNGCGDHMAAKLSDAGVLVLDCHSQGNFSLDLVKNHQRTWCANHRGEILP